MDTKPVLNIAVSSRALFDFEEENKIFQERGAVAYRRHQHQQLDRPAKKGVSFALVEKLLAFNQYAGKKTKGGGDHEGNAGEEQRLVNISVISRNDPTTGLRVFRAINHYRLDIRQGCFTRGDPPYRYLRALGAHLFLSADSSDVRCALRQGVAAAHVLGGASDKNDEGKKPAATARTPQKPRVPQLRIAFDGDAVLFGDQSEQIFQQKGLDAFISEEKKRAQKPMQPGPLAGFFRALCELKNKLPATAIRTALITARGAPAHERPIRTLMDWGLDIDEAFFLNGMTKAEVIREFQPDFYFDDQVRHLRALPAATPAAHVDFGIANAGGDDDAAAAPPAPTSPVTAEKAKTKTARRSPAKRATKK